MKKQIKKIMVAVLIGAMLAGCAASGQAAGGQATGSDTLTKVLEKKKLVVGVLPDFAPWGSRNAAGEFEGYDVDLAKALGEALGVEVQIEPIEAPNRVPALVSGKVDVIIACLTPSDERAKTVDFTIPYASAGLIPMMRADDNSAQSYLDLKGKKVALVRGGMPDLVFSKLVPEADIARFDTIADAYTAFKSGKVDAFIEEDSFVFSEIKKDPTYKAIGETFSTEYIAFAMKKNDQSWLNFLNNFLGNMRYTGKNAELYEKWLGHAPKSLVAQ